MADCLSCGASNRDGQKFCGNCGAQLATACPSCGAAYEPGQRFCGDCGTSLAAAEPAAAPPRDVERRVVTVLFADLVGFTSLSESRDAEDVRRLLTSYFDTARLVIGRYGGVVEKFIGDAVMAVWGAPTAREDDSERAVRAALELVEAVAALDAGLHARAGVLTGEAAVTLGATVPGSAADCTRDAVLTRSPATSPWPAASSVTAASPVTTPARACSPASRVATASTRSSAARTARSASSSRAVGAPHTAITASPMNFSTVPPYRAIR